MQFEVALQLNGLMPEDVKVEILLSRAPQKEDRHILYYPFGFKNIDEKSGDHIFTLDLAPELCGKLDYTIRSYPHHDLLTHPYETGLMIWL